MPPDMPDPLDDLPTGKRRRLAAGDALFRAGDASVGLVRIYAGRIELRRAGESGRESVLQRAGPGETLAEASQFESQHHCDAVAVTPAVVSVLDRAAVGAAALLDPALAWRLAAHLARRLVEARARAEYLSLPGAADRLLAALRSRRLRPDGTRLVGGTWRSLACECGLSEEAAYRTLAKLERSGRLRRLRGPEGPAALLV